jgi:hypothetical protein
MGVLFGAFQEVLGNELGAQGISGEQDAFGNLALFCCNMWCTHDEASLSACLHVEIFFKLTFIL